MTKDQILAAMPQLARIQLLTYGNSGDLVGLCRVAQCYIGVFLVPRVSQQFPRFTVVAVFKVGDRWQASVDAHEVIPAEAFEALTRRATINGTGLL